MSNHKFSYILLTMILFFSACSEKTPFSALNIGESLSVPSALTNSVQGCSNFTLVKPQVDILFVWDNSSSTFTLAEGVKTSVQKTLDDISSRFDYHILIAPLIPNQNAQSDFNSFSLVVDNTNGLTSTTSSGVVRNPFSILKARENIQIFNNVLSPSVEYGFLRSRSIISENRNNGIFRNNAYTIIVMISNEDDDDYPGSTDPYGNPAAASDISTHLTAFLNLKSALGAQMFRFMSIAAQNNTCPPSGSKLGNRYRMMSNQIYSISGATDQAGSASPDAYNICTLDFANMFYGINNSIKEIVQKHIYGFWPLAPSTAPPFDPSQVVVTKSTGQVLTQGDTSNGFTILSGVQTNLNLRIGPTPIPGPGEPYTGYAIQLYGQGRVTFPECLLVKTQTPAEYYGYFVLSRAPDFNFPVEIKINGVTISQSSTNGWQYLGFTQAPTFPSGSVNVRIQGPILNPGNPHSPASPALNKTGYVFKLNGSAILTNGQVITINYKPAPI